MATWFWWVLFVLVVGCFVSWVFVKMHMSVIDKQTFERLEHKKRKEKRQFLRRVSEKKATSGRNTMSGFDARSSRPIK